MNGQLDLTVASMALPGNPPLPQEWQYVKENNIK